MGSQAFDNFQIVNDEDGHPVVLGSGGMGVTYRAWDTHLAREVALKVIRPSWLEQPLAKERFIREARALAQIHHPNVVGIVNLGETDEGCYYTMEFIDGQNLEDRVNEKGALDVAWTLYLGRQIAAALNAASKKDIVHRDIKPANIMLVEDEAEGVTAKLIDFGLARNFVPETGSEHTGPLTIQGSFVGTPQFASPEQIEEQELDVRSDIYSLGICLFYSLTGDIPFNGSTARVMSAQLTEQPDWSSLKAPKGVVALLKKMLRKDPDNRFQTAQALYTEIDALLSEALKKTRDKQLSTIVSREAQPPGSGDSRPIDPSDADHVVEPAEPKRKMAIVGISAAIVLLAVALGLWWPRDNEETAEPSSLVVVEIGNSTQSGNGSVSEPKKPEVQGTDSTSVPSEAEKGEGDAPEAPSADPDGTTDVAAAKGTSSSDPMPEPSPGTEPTPKPDEASKKEDPVETPSSSPPAAAPGPAEWEIVAKNARKVRDDLAAEYTGKLEELNTFYLKSLRRLLEAETAASRLDSALVIDAEIKRIEAITIDTAVESQEKSSINDLSRGRSIYLKQAQPIHKEFVTKRDAVLEAYEKLFDAQEAKLREANQLAELEKLEKARAEIFSQEKKEQ